MKRSTYATVLAAEKPLETATGFSFGAAFCLAAMIFGASVFAGLLFQFHAMQLATLGFSGFTVPDAISLESSVYLAWAIDWDQIPNIRTFLGVVLVYFPITIWGGTYTAVVNVLMLALSAAIFSSLLQRLAIRDRGKVWLFALFAVATNLYVVSSLLYPNKEVPIIFLTTLFVWSMISGRWQLALFCAVVSYWFRDGHALILGAVLGVVLARRFTYALGGLLSVVFLIVLFVAFPISDVQDLDTSLQRNVHLGASMIGEKFSSLGELAAYAVRLTGNALNLGLRPQMADVHGGVYVLGVGYWQFGIILLGGIFWACGNALASEMPRSIVALAIIVALAGLSYSAFVQPRYLMSLIFPLTLGLSEHRLGRYVVLGAVLAVPVSMLLLGGLPPLAQG